MRKIIMGLMVAVMAMAAATVDAEAARRKKKKPVHKAAHHRVHKHKRQHIPVTDGIILLQATSGPDCGFFIFKSPCNSNAANNISAAQSFVGMDQHQDRRALTNFLGVDPARIPWCAAFVNNILKKNGFASTESLMAASYLNYGEITRTPRPGDVVIFSKLARGQATGHVAFYVDTITQDGQSYILALGGNQGNQVSISAYPASKVMGFRRPVADSI